MIFKICWAIDAIATLVALYFFAIGIADGTVSSRNMLVWIGLISVLGFILMGSIWLRSHQYILSANTLLLVITIPALIYLLYILMALSGKQRWN